MSQTDPAPYSFNGRVRCPACHSTDTRIRFETSFAQGGIGTFVRHYYQVDPTLLGARPYRLDECGRCGLVFQAFIGDDRLLADLYTHWVGEPQDPERDIDTYRADMAAVRLSRDAHEIMAASSFTGVSLDQLRTLDYGMGWALWARIAATLGCRSYGSDLAEPRMDFARRHGVEAVTDEQIGALRFDFINTEQVFEHVPEPLELLRRLSASLAPGGIVKLSLPSGERADGLIDMLAQDSYDGDYPSIIPVQPLEHINSFKWRSIQAMATAAGMRIVRPSLWHRYAFLRHRGTIDPRRPKKTAKELVRPVYQHRDPSNLFVWLRRD